MMKEKELKIYHILSADLDNDGKKIKETFEHYEMKFPVEFTKDEVSNLLKAKYPDKKIDVIESMVPDTKWNRYVQMINKRITELDDNYEAQRKLIDETKMHAIAMGFCSLDVLRWFASQNQICMNNDPKLKDMDPIKRSMLIESSTFWSTYGIL